MTELRKTPQPDNMKVINHEGYRWVYQKADLEQGAYSLSDPDLNKIAVISPIDRARPIDAPGKNARLLIRHFGSDDWHESKPHSLPEALQRGNQHADLYRSQMQVQTVLKVAGRRTDRAHGQDGQQSSSTQKARRRRPRRKDRDPSRER